MWSISSFCVLAFFRKIESCLVLNLNVEMCWKHKIFQLKNSTQMKFPEEFIIFNSKGKEIEIPQRVWKLNFHVFFQPWRMSFFSCFIFWLKRKSCVGKFGNSRTFTVFRTLVNETEQELGKMKSALFCIIFQVLVRGSASNFY